MEDLYVLSFFCKTEYKELYKEIMEETPIITEINLFWESLEDTYIRFFKGIKPYRVYQNAKNKMALFKIENFIYFYREFLQEKEKEKYIVVVPIPIEEWNDIKEQEKEDSLYDL